MIADVASKAIFAVGVVAVVAVGVSSVSRRAAEPAPVAPAQAAAIVPTETPAQIREKVRANLRLRTTKQDIDGFGNVLMISFTIKNDNHFPVKDVVVWCSVLGGSGTSLSNNRRTVYETIPAGSSIMIHDLNMGFINTQSKSAGCVPEDFAL